MTPMNTWSVPSCIESFAQKRMAAKKKVEGIPELEPQARVSVLKPGHKSVPSDMNKGRKLIPLWIVVIPLLTDEKMVYLGQS
jgi:hypothetical protein